MSDGKSATTEKGYKKLYGQKGWYHVGEGKYNGFPSGGGGGGYYGGYSNMDEGPGGGGSGYIGGVIDFRDIKKKTYAGNEQFPRFDYSGNGAARITLLGYLLTLQSKIETSYFPGSTIYLDFSLTSMGINEEAKIFRSINDTAEILIKSHQDEGEIYNFTDSFDLPFISSYYTITYRVQSKSDLNTSFIYQILVTKVPQLLILSNPKPKYILNETVSVDIELSDDTYSKIIINDDDLIRKCFTIYCNNILNRSTLNFNIPPTYKVYSSRNFTLVAVDEFGLQSTKFSFVYEIVPNRSPDIALTNNISYLLDNSSPIHIQGSIRDFEIPSNVCVMAAFDLNIGNKQNCLNIENTDWIEFSFSLSVNNLNAGLHTLSLYGIDDHQGQSNTVNHYFAFSKKSFIIQRTAPICNSPYSRTLAKTLGIITLYL